MQTKRRRLRKRKIKRKSIDCIAKCTVMTMNLNGIFKDGSKPVEGCTLVDGLNICDTCGKQRSKRIVLDGNEYIVPIMCPCEVAAEKRREQEQQAIARERRVAELRRRGLMDNKYLDHRFAVDEMRKSIASKVARKYVTKWDEFKRDNIGLMFTGTFGTGKTFYAACIANALIDQGVPVIMTSLPTVLNKLTGSFEKQDIIDELTAADLLILDDYGTERKTDFAMEQVFALIDQRYRSNRPLIITTNLEKSDLENAPTMDEQRINERILAMCAMEVKATENVRARKRDKKSVEVLRRFAE